MKYAPATNISLDETSINRRRYYASPGVFAWRYCCRIHDLDLPTSLTVASIRGARRDETPLYNVPGTTYATNTKETRVLAINAAMKSSQLARKVHGS